MQEEGRNYWQTEDPVGGDSDTVASPSDSSDVVETEPISWDASEYIHHQKDIIWFIGLIVIAVVLISLSVFLVRSWTFTALLIVMVVAVVVFALRPPRTLHYRITSQGLEINDKSYSFHDFKAFGVLQDGPLYSVVLIPVKRFMPSVNIYFPQEFGEDIVDRFGDFIPMEPIHLDLIDSLVRRLRF